jgi:hypothetical protein
MDVPWAQVTVTLRLPAPALSAVVTEASKLGVSVDAFVSEFIARRLAACRPVGSRGNANLPHARRPAASRRRVARAAAS